MKSILKIIFSICLISITSVAFAKGGHGGHHGKSSLSSPGTGSKSSSEQVSGYTAKSGKQVDSYRRSTSDTIFNNNFSTKGNVNPTTGKKGTRSTPEKGGQILMER